MKETEILDLQAYEVYKKFINECKIRPLDETLVYHKHHVIPKHMNSKEYTETVLLSVKEHANAHLLLSQCFMPGSYEQLSNLRSANLLDTKSIKNKMILKF